MYFFLYPCNLSLYIIINILFFLKYLFEDNQDNITIFSSLPHSHLASREIYSTVIRDGKEIFYIANEKYYDFNYQYLNFLQKPFVFKRNDEIKVTCSYSTPGRKTATIAGLSTFDEMVKI